MNVAIFKECSTAHYLQLLTNQHIFRTHLLPGNAHGAVDGSLELLNRHCNRIRAAHTRLSMCAANRHVDLSGHPSCMSEVPVLPI